tara:strand:- start:216 stop:848 length:633 start_codon:yes stop_codon:yes gene_type:complete
MNIKEILEDPRLIISPTAPPEQMVSQFGSYLDLLVKWNQKINLTSEKSSQDILLRHIFDSLQYAAFISSQDEIVDIGSGAGFPGIPLKIIYPELVTTLIESQRKRCSFLETVISQLGLTAIKVINDRAEKTSPKRLVEAVILRGVSDIKSCLELATPFLGEGGKVVLKKGLEERGELKQPIYGFALEQEIVVTGYNNKKSSLLVFLKNSI